MTEIRIPSLEDIDRAAKQLVNLFAGQKKIAISGEMGAGKTTLIQALCRVMGVQDVVASPTFALINEYFTPDGESIYHFDLFRIEDVSELYDIGYEDYFYSDATCFIEWPEKAMELMPGDVRMLTIHVLEDGTRVVTGGSSAGN
jgi:tRNA threonylcarbamoyladenosine biosynthesis protein TsaE